MLVGKSELEIYSGEENRGQSVRDGALLDELGSPAFCICFTRMFTLCEMRCMSYACNMHMTCKNQDIICIHAPINMPTIWFMSSTCHMQGIGTYFMHLTCV